MFGSHERQLEIPELLMKRRCWDYRLLQLPGNIYWKAEWKQEKEEIFCGKTLRGRTSVCVTDRQTRTVSDRSISITSLPAYISALAGMEQRPFATFFKRSGRTVVNTLWVADSMQPPRLSSGSPGLHATSQQISFCPELLRPIKCGLIYSCSVVTVVLCHVQRFRYIRGEKNEHTFKTVVTIVI